ncbi:DUF1800 domain-containing protein [Phenylobacterium sp.]|uniref:DUF1800 domain-containing protein n=1 Tax=Phenylobacterium sp. TaxID=1871053 RepID=UPI0025DF9EC3|nr:DUF1800 domain-containing protein [Phenylobacterium sp.]
MAANPRELDAAIAVTRFGLGAQPGEIAAARPDPRGWLKAQIRPSGAETFDTGGETSAVRLAEFRAYRRARVMAESADGGGADPAEAVRRFVRENAVGDVQNRIRLALQSPAGFRERWALFWANHFTVSAVRIQVATLVGPYENEAIRPRVFGRFADLLAAAETHPAMLLYLDQAQSVGPNSRAARVRNRAGAGRPAGLNENLAREILELHTVGIDGGYTQADVTEFARALTGLSLARPDEPATADPVVFRAPAHEPGGRTVMGRHYPDSGEAQATAILADLASHPQTARFVCRKIARHFVADDPPPALTARLEAAWLASGGDLARVAEALVDAPEAWDARPSKFKTPYEFVVSSYRALGGAPRGPQVSQALNTLGQRPFGAPSPKGWPDDAAPWAASDALVKRMQVAQALGAAAGPRVAEPASLAEAALGARLTPASAAAIRRAESRAEAVALLLMTPEFQRR